MKCIPVVILAVVALVAGVTGCDSMRRYDARLAAADSLMRSAPDSALAIVQAVDRDSLASEGDRAYRDLLLTQARYRCYITATSDSDINRALAWYRAHSGEREKLTRALIYKGAVMEELGHPDSAMLYYKQAEANADEKDYFNLGQINTRIGSLYRYYYANEEICFDKYSKSLYYYRLAQDKQLEQNSLYNMAVCSTILNSEESKKYLKQALDLALELNDSSCIYRCQERLCILLALKESNYSEAKKIAHNCLNNFSGYVDNGLLLDMAYINACQGFNDSARYYLGLVNEKELRTNSQNKIKRNLALAVIYKNDGDTAKSNFGNSIKSTITDSIDNNIEKYQIEHIEILKNNEFTVIKNQRIKDLRWIICFLAFLFLSLLTVLIIYHYHRVNYIKSIITAAKEADLNKHEELLYELKHKDTRISHYIENLVAFIQMAIDSSEHDSPKVIRKRLKEYIITVVNDDFWNELMTILNKRYDGIMTNLSQNSRLTENDLRFIGLMLCGFNYVEIAITMGYYYISQKRIKIAKKLALKTSLQDYIEYLKDKK